MQMKISLIPISAIASLVLISPITLLAEEASAPAVSVELPTLILKNQETANERSATTYTTPVSNLEFDPRIDLQSRNMAEAQGDITIRGGIFENTGIRLGSATLIDPQTGHYFAELPIAPEMLTSYQVFTGADNAHYGFNSTVGTISFGWAEIKDGGSATVGGGDHNLNFQRLHHAQTVSVGNSGEWKLGIEAEYSRSESDGSIAFGDHDFYRSSGRVQLLGPSSQTDFFVGYQEKFFGWPNMYTPFGVNETENLKTSLFLINHQHHYDERSYVEATAYYREHKDHYIFSRENPAIFQAKHTTDVSAIGFSGLHAFDGPFGINYAGQFTADSIESTSLEMGRFQSRSYYKLSLLPEYRIELNKSDSLTLRAGGSFDDTNRNDSEFSFITDLTWKRKHGNGTSESLYLSYAESSQVVGYTAIGGVADGLFGSNPNLDTETSQNLELGGTLERSQWSLSAALFYRWDKDLTDWTFTNAAPFTRTANPVDLETFGLELIATRKWKQFEAIASYTYLDKDEDYGANPVDASFYALNYARHRITLGAIWRPVDWLELRIDNEWREQKENELRRSSDSALFTHLGASFYPPNTNNLEIFLAAENLGEEDFEEVPGTPGRGDQYSGGLRYSW
ncbi:MAG: TonB-dependent receptor plug domain-containing protein [Opitutales bacterium]